MCAPCGYNGLGSKIWDGNWMGEIWGRKFSAEIAFAAESQSAGGLVNISFKKAPSSSDVVYSYVLCFFITWKLYHEWATVLLESSPLPKFTHDRTGRCRNEYQPGKKSCRE